MQVFSWLKSLENLQMICLSRAKLYIRKEEVAPASLNTSPQTRRQLDSFAHQPGHILNSTTRILSVSAVLVIQSAISIAQETLADSSPMRSPIETAAGILYGNPDGSELRLLGRGSDRIMCSGNGCGKYVTLSPDARIAGVKLIDETGRQMPAVVNLDNGTMTQLWPPGEQAGQVSFTADGKYAFTAGNELIVTDGKIVTRYPLGSYANLAPISPDGRHVAYNDIHDQLWIQELSTGNRFRITDPATGNGYWYPLWAPDGSKLLYLSLDGKMLILDTRTNQTVSLGEGFSPAWSPDSRYVVFSRRVIRGEQLLNADLYLATADGKMVEQITDSDSLMETEASFVKDGSAIIFRSHNADKIYRVAFSEESLQLGPPRVVATVEMLRSTRKAIGIRKLPATTPETLTALRIPYINQVYDTPDWFNGHAACGPTSSMMVLAYYNILPRWDTWCSSPSPGHTSWWGRYICERYYFHQREYAALAEDPSGHFGAGAYGFMWSSGSPHSTMEGYYTYHGLSAQLTDAPPYSKAVTEVNDGYPYTICVGLTTAGHIVVANGLGTNQGTIIVHDPYGNKNFINTNGYPNYQGRNVPYDWPGYNNGYENLNTVYWAVSSHGTLPVAADTLVDDTQYGMGFYLHTSAPASMTRWKDLTRGYGNHAWFTYTTTSGMDTCYGTWTPNLGLDGSYEVLAYVPISRATAAQYVIVHKDGTDTVVINQKVVSDSWVSLGTYRFDQGTTGFVRLGDASDTTGQEIVFDAVRWSLRSAVAVNLAGNGRLPARDELSQNFPNPFNPSTRISFTLGSESNVRLSVYNILGEEVDILEEGRRAQGPHETKWSPTHLPSGIYVGVLEVSPCSGEQRLRMTRKMLLVR